MTPDLASLACLAIAVVAVALPIAGRMIRAGGGRPSPLVPPMHPGWILAAILLGVAITP